MDGLSECFELQNRAYVKKVDIRNKRIETLKGDLDTIKTQYETFKKESTIDAFFKKHTDIVDRTGRRQKDYIKDLNKQVDDFLASDNSLEQVKLKEEMLAAKEQEPSGVDSLLIQLQQLSSKVDMPGMPENPLANLDAEREVIMDDFKQALRREAN